MGLEERGLSYVVGISTTTTAQPEAARPHPPPYGGRGPRPQPAYPEPARMVKKLVPWRPPGSTARRHRWWSCEVPPDGHCTTRSA
ncbi:transposase [Streptomyces sp. NPDC051132]|uniref:transposase n=1 Tax=Streptomyces sp. NPDC051132 TaxID=3155667 RepID=UPI00342F0FD0